MGEGPPNGGVSPAVPSRVTAKLAGYAALAARTGITSGPAGVGEGHLLPGPHRPDHPATLLARYQAEGEAAFEPRSRRSATARAARPRTKGGGEAGPATGTRAADRRARGGRRRCR